LRKKNKHWLVVSIPLKNMKVRWDDDIPNIWKNKIHVPNHQPEKSGWTFGPPRIPDPTGTTTGLPQNPLERCPSHVSRPEQAACHNFTRDDHWRHPLQE